MNRPTVNYRAIAGCLLVILAAIPLQASPQVLRFAVLGDAEPKPEPAFPHMEAAVRHVNQLAATLPIDFVVGVGDIAHKGTVVQYEAATDVLRQLQLPFYPIMGNEEHNSTVERYLEYVARWKPARDWTPSTRYVLEFTPLALVFASPDFSREFSDAGIDWILQNIRKLHPKPVILIVHGAHAGAFAEAPDKGVHNPGFKQVVQEPNMAAVISGDLHMDMDRVKHSLKMDGVHYLHIPGLERTKIPDESHHQAMFRVVTVFDNDKVEVDTYAVGTDTPLTRHAYQFALRR